jgi:hypothetical protein
VASAGVGLESKARVIIDYKKKEKKRNKENRNYSIVHNNSRFAQVIILENF